MNFSFGGSFNSRLNLNLREAKGYTYGVRSGFSGNKYNSAFSISTSVKRVATAPAIVEILKEIKSFTQSGSINDEELTYTKNSMLNSKVRGYESTFQKASFLSRVIEYNLDKNYTQRQAEVLNSMTKEDIHNLAVKNIDMSKMSIIIVGDKESIERQLENKKSEINAIYPEINVGKVKSINLD